MCLICLNTRAGLAKYTDMLPTLEIDIRSLVDPNTCTHPTFKTTFRYTRMTAKAVLESLVKEKQYKKEELPAESTMRELLGKRGYRLRRVQKTKVQKKFQRRTQSLPTSKKPIFAAITTTKPYAVTL